MNLKLLHIFLLSTGGTLLLCTPLIHTTELVNGLVIGKMCWFHLVMLFFSVCVFFVVLTKRTTAIAFLSSDLLLLIFTGTVLITYKWSLNPEPEKLIFIGQLVIFWFLLRYILTAYREFNFFFLFVGILTGLVEAVWGMQQLHGHAYSNHSLFRLTGSFFNPGPYSGYLAVVLPVGLWMALRFQKGMRCFGYICVGAILIVLPAGMSRSAWMAAVVACGWVYWAERIGWEKTKAVYRRNKNATIPFIAIVAILVGCAIAELYGLKRDSADGRLLMWKVTGKAIAGHPVTGTGLGGFPEAYAEMQGHYGIRNRQHGAAGGVLALAVFAVSSYPLQLPSFWVALVFLGAICVTKDGTQIRSSALSVSSACHITIISLLSLASVCLFILQKGQYEVYKRWGRLQMLYNNKAYESVAEDYHDLHDKLKHKPEFLFEEAQCLSKTGQHAEAIRVLERAKRLSGDPMIRYMIAKNRQTLGDYREAEEELLQAIGILPERLYPYYLLAKLYAEPEFYQADKLRAAAGAVLSKEPKVETTAIWEMREEVKKIIDKGDFD